MIFCILGSTTNSGTGTKNQIVSFDFEPTPPKIKNFGDAIQSLEDVQTFLDSKEYSEQ